MEKRVKSVNVMKLIRRVVLLAGLLSLAVAGPALAAGWAALQEQAKEALSAGAMSQAADLSAQAVSAALKALKADDPRLGDVLLTAGEAHRKYGQVEKARRYYRYALSLAQKRYPAGHQRVSLLKLRLAELPRTSPQPRPKPKPKPQPKPTPQPSAKPQPRPPAEAPPDKPEASETPALPVTVEIVQYGLFRTERDKPESRSRSRVTYGDADIGGAGQVREVERVVPVRQTNRIPNRKGVIFGIGFKVNGDPALGKVKMVIKLLSPPRVMSGSSHKAVLEEFDQEMSVGKGAYWLHGLGGPPAARPMGKWTYQVFQGGRKLAEQSFIIYQPSPEEDGQDSGTVPRTTPGGKNIQ